MNAFILRAFLDIQPSRGAERDGRWQQEVKTLTVKGGGKDVCWVQPKTPEGRVVIFQHNWGVNKSRYFLIADQLAAAGNDVLLCDLRGHGSRRMWNPFWVFNLIGQFKNDLLAIIEDLKGREDFRGKEIFLMGYSVGSSVALEALKANSQIRGVICDSGPFSLTLGVIQLLVARAIPRRPKWVQKITSGLFYFAVNWPRHIRVTDHLEKCQGRSLLLIQGERESFITTHDMNSLKENWPGPKTFWLVPRAQHLMNYSVDPREYVKRITEFLAS